MVRPLKEIEQELLGLPEAERARLAHRLIVSLDADVRCDDQIMAIIRDHCINQRVRKLGP